MERLREAFSTYFRRDRIGVATPKRPLVVVIFADRQRYLEHAEPTLCMSSPSVIGFYNLMSKRVTTYDITGSGSPTGSRLIAANSSRGS